MASVNDVPKVFRDIKIELPLLLDSLQSKPNAEISPQVQSLDEILGKVLVHSKDSSWQRSRKALSSLGAEKQVQGIVETLRGYVQVLTYYQATCLAGSKRPIDSQKSPQPVFTVPFGRDPRFIDCAEITSELEKRLRTYHRAALAGIGGVGKTQIAIEYCYRYRERDPTTHVFWVHASTASRIDQGYKEIARKLGLPGWEDQSSNTFEVVSEWLNEHGQWLFVFDNADDVDLLFGPAVIAGQQKQMHEYLPRCEGGTTIITTRDKRVASRLTDREDPITVLPMNTNDAGALLRSKTTQGEGPIRDLTRDSELLEVLGNLPLAITQAAAFITENNITIAEYLEVFATNRSEVEALLSEEMVDKRRYSESGNSIMSTLKLSFDQIVKEKPLAADLLSFMAFLDPNGIPRSLLKYEDVRNVDFVSALGALQAVSLIGAENGGTSFEIHRLVQLSTQRWLRGSRAKWETKVLEVLSARFPHADYSNWKECEMLSPHAQIAVSYSDQSDTSAVQRARILHNLARYDGEQSRYELAEKRYTEVVAIRERVLGISDPDTLKSMSYLGEILFREGKYSAAEPILRRVIAECEKIFGAQSDERLYNIGLLADVVQGEGQLAEAEKLFRLVFEGGRETLEDASALKIASSLGAVLRDEKKFEESEMWIRKSLVGREKLLGPTHLDTLRSVEHLALLLSIVGRLEEAELAVLRAVAGSEMAMGPDHHLTLMSVHTYGKILHLQGKHEAAIEQCLRALDGFVKVLGREDRGTLRCFQTLALINEGQGRLEEAEALLRQVVEGNRKALSDGHQHTLDSVENLERVVTARMMRVDDLAHKDGV